MVNKSPKRKKIGALSIKNVTKIYDPSGVNVKAVDDCSMDIAGGEVCMIVGPSGCGKTTLLNAIAGFHSITEGSIHLDGELLCGPTKPKAEQSAERMVVFQHGALFPWKTLQENVAYGPTVQRVLSTNEAMDKAGQMLAEAGLGQFVKKYPGEVSSGMARRAEIVRALINNPKVLLLDEPFAGVDPLAVGDLQQLISSLRHRGVGMLITDHNVRETLSITDYACILTDGRILASGRADELAADAQVKQYYLGEDFKL